MTDSTEKQYHGPLPWISLGGRPCFSDFVKWKENGKTAE